MQDKNNLKIWYTTCYVLIECVIKQPIETDSGGPRVGCTGASWYKKGISMGYLHEPRRKKTDFSQMQIQRRRSASL